MIIVTGATGTLGAQIVDQLLRRVPADQVGVSVRNPDRAADLAARGVRVRRGDFTDPSSLADAFEGAGQVLIVSAGEVGERAVAHHRAAIDAARDAGAERIVYTSHQAADAASRFAPMPDHAATERYLEQTGTAYTALRNGFYASTVPLLVANALDSGQLVSPADGPVSWTAHADLAAAAAAICADPGRFDGPTPPLTATEALDLADVAEMLSERAGRTISRVVADDDEWAATLIGHGTPAPRAAMLLGMFHASRNDEFNVTDPTLEALIGHRPTSLRATLDEHSPTAGTVAGRR